MKKWIFGLLITLVAGYFLAPTLLNIAGVHTTRILLFNGNDKMVVFILNGTPLELVPGQAQVVRSSRFNNRLRYEDDGQHYKFSFGPGQHIVNLGDGGLHLKEVYYHWDEVKGEFFPRDSAPRNRLLVDQDINRGLQTLDNCWDCCLLLPPGERPYRHLTAANKAKRFFISSVN